MPQHADFVECAVSGTPGTGAITLGAATTGNRTFSTAFGADATVDILLIDGANRGTELGAVYNHAGGTITRGTHSASTTGAQLSLTADATVSVVATADSGRRWDSAFAALPGLAANGLTLANNATDASNDIDIAPGVAPVTDGVNWYVATLTATLVKRLDAAWAVGTNQGGLDTGSKATSTWYHVWLIHRSDTSVVDVLFSTSATSPTMPTSYDRKRRIGAIFNNASNAIDSFVQLGDEFLWKVRKKDVAAANPGTSAVLRTLSVPLGIQVLAKMAHSLFDNSYSAATYVLLTSPDADDVPPAVDENTLVNNGTGLTTLASSSVVEVRTNTSSQIRSRLHASDADRTLRIQTIGWVDPRGSY